jgi:formylglycine-generating enzyme required for sulfatase activity
MAASRESSDEDLPMSEYDPADNVIRPKFDGEAPPPPPEFGTVLPAPPASSAEMPTLPATGELPAASGGGNRRILVIAGAVAVVLGIGGFAAGRFGSDDEQEEPQPSAEASAQPPPAATKQAPPAPVPAPVDAQAAVEPRCPRGMVYVEAGKFFMGTESRAPLFAGSRPAHQVGVEAFCIDQTEVTLRAYRECSSIGECKRAFRDAWWPQGEMDSDRWDYAREQHSKHCNENFDSRLDHPINCVSWAQANDYCRWRGAKLPTEEQWEFAARGSEGRPFPWGEDAPDSEHVNACGSECVTWQAGVEVPTTAALYEDDDGFSGTAPVGSFAAGNTPAGISDLAGNVAEWTADLYVPYSDSADAGAEPSRKRVVRGGGFDAFQADFADPALRNPQSPNAHPDTIGFRCVAEPRR